MDIKDDQELIKKKASQDMVIILEGWKRRKRKQRIYRYSILGVMTLSILALLGIGYLQLDQKVPSIIRLKAGVEQILDWEVPMTAEVVAVSEQGESNISDKSITMNLGSTVKLIPGSAESYQMDVKLFGWIPFKQVDIQVIEEQELIPVGVPVGIYVETDGILVVGVGEFTGENGQNYSPAKNILQSGDYIRQLNGKAVGDKDKFIKDIEESMGEEVILTIKREEETMDVKIKPEKNQSGVYKLGVWVRDNAQGVGTMTFIDADGNFGALGHGINDIDTSTLMNMNDGTLYQTKIISIKKGENGDPGEMTGMIVYSSDRILGDIDSNSIKGIFGTCNEKAMEIATEDPLPIGLKQEIVVGPAQILCTVEDEPEYFDIEILKVHQNHDNINRGIELKVTDPELLEITGGIIQGMSGSPVIQNGKLVGAVTHVCVNL
ncbi:MAG: SpoIVB peptidase [Lachnospiraceae bacterium]|nr:SpoIVB peptidase [Lachnospiraceae bacterium]